MSPAWRILLRRIVVLLTLAGALGWAVGQVAWIMLAAALGCLGWQLAQLYRLDCWLREGSPMRPPTPGRLRPGPVWDGVYRRCFELRRRSRRRKRKVSRILKQFQAAAAVLPDAVVVLDGNDTLLWCNDASERLLGLQRRDCGLKVTNLVRHPAFVDFLGRRRCDQSLEFPGPCNVDTTLNVRMVPYSKTQWLLLVTDNTRLHRLEQTRRDFIANVSHELRTPLTVIKGYLETLLDSEATPPSRWFKPLRGMQQQASRMLRLVEDLLLLARLENPTERPLPRPVNAPALLDAIVEDAAALSGEHGHRLRLEVDRRLWIRANEQELHSAFANLVFNAVRYTPDGGRIIVRWYADERGLHLEVEDNGEGIPAHHLARITERFYRVNRDRSRDSGGTGLGLAIVKHVMINHGGRLGVASLVGVGSIFACDFPLALRVQQESALALLD